MSTVNRRNFLASALAAGASPLASAPAPRPNILLILADDLGWSDLGCYGSEIRTPNLDKLAQGGVRFTQFYNSARCCPSRASIMTGLYPHQAGMGNMTSPRPRTDFPGYAGQLNSRTTTIPEVMKQAGYSTWMTGKWHLGPPGPVGRGFDDYYGMVHGFDSFWDESKYTRLPAGRPKRTYSPGKFYATEAITDHTLDFLAAARKQDKPFFFYLAYNAPHFPLHAPKEVIDEYMPIYEKGWDHIRRERYERMRAMGLITKDTPLTPLSEIPPNRFNTQTGWAGKVNPPWDSLDPDRRRDLARRMATFAAMVDVMDRNIGRVLDDLRANNQLDNTLIFFTSDNGACAEWDPYGFDVSSGPINKLHRGPELDQMGQPGTYHSYGSAWANTCNTPWRLYKHYNHEGGITSPFIAHWPNGIQRRNAIDHTPGHIIDFMPTCVELAGATYPASLPAAAVPAMEGTSLVPALQGKRLRRDTFYWEHEGNRAIRIGKWKAVALLPTGAWELYDMNADRAEMHNLAARHPARVKSMVKQWEQWARRTQAIPWMWTPQYQPSE
ncbi:MAG: arylsulfatase [Bryobacterales bacterium]|nr:arylsulfatase [Bryobacterales bacterium]